MVAEMLNVDGLATLLFDLLTPSEEAVDLRTRQLRFDIPLLAERLLIAGDAITDRPDTAGLPVGTFGASTGAAAALILLALGVPTETVVADYGLSDGYNIDVRKAIYEHLRPFGVDIKKVAPYFTAPESRIRALLEHVDARYGSAVDYLVKKAGVSKKAIALLKDALLE